MFWFILDSRGYDTPDLIGPFDSHEEAVKYSLIYGHNGEDTEILLSKPPIGVAVVE